MKLTKKLEDMTLQEMFKVFMEQYHEVIGKSTGSGTSLRKEWEDLKKQMIITITENSGLDFADTYVSDLQKNGKVTGLGFGMWTAVPGISVRHKDIASVQNGVYISYLFNKDTKCAYLTLAQAAQEYNNSVKKLNARVKDLKNMLNITEFSEISVNTGKDSYDAGTIAAKEYTLATLPDDAQLYQDLRAMVKVYERYLALSPAAATTKPAKKYTDDQLCAILKMMIDDAKDSRRKNAALAAFGIVYGEFISKENIGKLLDATAYIGDRSNEGQLNTGKNIYKYSLNNPGTDVLEVFDEKTATAAELKDQIDAEHKTAKKGTKDATTVLFGIRNSKIIAHNGIKYADIYGDGGLVALGCQIAEFLEKFPKYKKQLPAEDVRVLYRNEYTETVLLSKNTIFRGAPGTGKSYLAKEIAADIVSEGTRQAYSDLSEEQKKQVGFVQFHPSYDYSDFVEGLRPKVDAAGNLGFELRDGVFKAFADRAKKELEKKFVFIIDEINRGEISKILGELFFSIDPGYRGEDGSVATQYSNLHPDEEFYIPHNVYIIGTMNDIDRSVDTFDFAMRRRFRFIEIKAEDGLKMLAKLPEKDEAIRRMKALNEVIGETEGLGRNYQIGAAYFKKLENIEGDDPFGQLWSDYLEPLLQEYVSGMPEENELMQQFRDAYASENEGHKDESAED